MLLKAETFEYKSLIDVAEVFHRNLIDLKWRVFVFLLGMVYRGGIE